jgi:hypothetical protein
MQVVVVGARPRYQVLTALNDLVDPGERGLASLQVLTQLPGVGQRAIRR